jgi:hypothetical protein
MTRRTSAIILALAAHVNPLEQCGLCNGRAAARMCQQTPSASLQQRHLEAFDAVRGDVRRLRRALHAQRGLSIAAIGSSYVVRGGCHSWQRAKCSDPRWSLGWLRRTFALINQTWPHPRNRLVNNARMATGPQYFVPCLSRAIPSETDLAIIGFGELCEGGTRAAASFDAELSNGSFTRACAANRAPPPKIHNWCQSV